MANEPTKVTKGGWISSALGAVVGIVIGGLVGQGLVISLIGGIEWVDPLGLGRLLGLALGGMIGGMTGSMLGALGTSHGDSPPGVTPGSPGAELARLKARVAELEEEKRNKGPSG